MANPYDALAANLQPQEDPATDNPYDAIVEDIQVQQQQRARTVFENSLASNPDQAAEAQRLAKQNGMPVDAVERNLDEVRRKEQARMLDLQRLAQDSPILARQLADPAFTKQAHDDLGALEQVGQFFTNTGKAAKAGVFNASKGAAGVFRAGFELAAPVLDPLEGVTAIGGNPLRRLAEGFAMQAADADASAKATAPKGDGNIAAGYYSGIQSLTQNLLALPMAFLPGGQGAALGMMTASTGGQSYQDAREKGLSMSQALPYAASQAAIEYATEKIPLGALIGDVKAGTGILKTLAKQMAMEIPNEQLATVLQDMNEWAVLNPEKPFRDYIDERPDAFVQTLVATIVGTGGNVVVAKGIETATRTLMGDAYDAGLAEQSAEQLQNALQTAAQSMLRQRNPDQFRDLMQQMAENTEGAPQEIYIDAEVLNQLAPEVLNQLPENVLAQMADALAANDVVSIPVADAMTVAPGTPLEQALVENARIGDPMAMSQAEAKTAGEQAQQYLAQEAERVIAQAQDAAAMQASSDRVRQGLLDQLNTAGRFSPAVNEAYATWTTAFHTTMAARFGITPEQMAERYPLRIGAQGGQGAVLDQGEPRVIYRGTNASGEKIKGGIAEGTLFAAADEAVAQSYAGTGGRVERIAVKPDAKILVEGSAEYAKVTGRRKGKLINTMRKGENLLTASNAVAEQARAAGYDAIEFTSMKDLGIAIFNEAMFVRDFGGQLNQSALPDTIEVDGKTRPTTNVNGKPIAQTEEGLRNFWRWFGESKVVDADGRPLVVYHGTDKKFSKINLKKGAQGLFWFTSDKSAIEAGEVGAAGRGGIMELYAKIDGPADWKQYDQLMLDEFKSRGLDGAILPESDGTFVGFILDKPTQIKSATGNRGTFDPADANILRQSGQTDEATGLPLNPDGTVTLYHHTSAGNAAQITKTGKLKSAGEPDVYVTTRKETDTGYGDTAVAVRVDPALLQIDDEFPDGRVDYRINTGKPGGTFAVKVGEYPTLNQQARATFNPESLELVLNENADLSSFLHETGHFFLEVMADLSSQPDAPAEVQQDMAALLKWFGIKGDENVGGPDAGGELAQAEKVKFTVKPPRKLYRGVAAETSQRAGGAAWAALGRGLYTTPDKKFAKQFGEVVELTPEEAWPRNPFVVDNAAGGAANAVWNAIRERGLFNGRRSEFDAQYPFLEDFLAPLGYDGVVAGGEVVRYSTSTLAQDGDLPTDNTQPVRRTPLETWNAMTLDQKRKYHERFAESFEQYLLEGKAPSVELAPLFRKFKRWMENVYKSLKQFIARTPDSGIVLSDEIRQVFDRMLATRDQIAQAEEVAGMVPNEDATEAAIERLTARSLRDLKWTVNARARAIKKLQKEARALREEVMIDVRREVMTQPIYRAWAFLKGRLTEEDAIPRQERRKSSPNHIDETQDSMFQAIAKLGGIRRDQLISQWGMDTKEKARVETGFGGKRSVDTKNGRTLDEMGMLLGEYGYLTTDENGRYDAQEFEEKFFDGLGGYDHFSLNFDYDATVEQKAGEQATQLTPFHSGRLDRASLTGLDPNVVTMLEARRMVRNDALHPDVVADLFGFASGEELVQALAEAQDPKDVIEGMTDQRMLERHGDLVDDRAIAEAANEAVHNEARARSLATELKAQADALGARTETGETNAKGSKVTVNALVEAAKQFAANVVSRTPIKDLKNRAWQHVAAERRAGKRWREATAKGETQEAIKAKQDQVLNNAAAKAANEAQAEAKKIVEFFRRVTKDGNEKTVEKGRDPDVVNAARAILAAYGVAPRGAKSALEYLAVVEKNDPDMFAMLQPSIQGALNMAQPLDALTMDELRSLHDEIQAMWHLAKRSRQMEVDGNLLDLQEAEDALQARMQEIGVPDTMPGDEGALTRREELARSLQSARSLLRRAEQWADGMGRDFTRLVFQPIKDAADRYRADRVKYRKKYQALVDQVAPFMPKGMIAAPELGYTFGRGHNGIGHAELLHAILHTGNESNKRKLLLGRKWATENPDGTLDTARWDAFVARLVSEGTLKKEHYDFAQGVWDLLEETKPLAQKTHRDVFGRYFAEVTADAFDTPFGQYRGGYAPAQADPRMVQDAALRRLSEQENENLAFAFPTTNKGFTKGRVEYNRPLILDLRTIGQHLDKVLLFSHMEPAARDVNRLLTRKGVSYSLGRIDPTVYESMLTPWLNRAAKQIVETPIVGDGRISRVLSAARSRAGMSLMFANVSNTLQQITGFSLAAVKVKPANMMRATAQFVAGPRAMAKAVGDASIFMAGRMENEVSAINDAMDQILLDPSLLDKAQAWTQRHAYFMQTVMANTMEPIIWTAAYNEALERGESERDAVRFADSVIRTTQGSTLPEDVSRIETGPAYARIFTQFIGYFNMMANTNAVEFKKLREEIGLKKGAGRAAYLVMAGLLIPLWVAEAIAIGMRGGPDDEDDDGYLDDWLAAVFGMGTIKGTLAMVPFVGQLANAGLNRLNNNPADDRVSLSPAVSLAEGSVGVISHLVKVARGEEINQRNAVRDVASAIGVTLGLPAYAIARPLGYLAGVDDDKIDPTGPVDQVRGLITGSASPESR